METEAALIAPTSPGGAPSPMHLAFLIGAELLCLHWHYSRQSRTLSPPANRAEARGRRNLKRPCCLRKSWKEIICNTAEGCLIRFVQGDGEEMNLFFFLSV